MVRNRREAPTVIKVQPDTHAALQEISRVDNRPMGEIVSDLVEKYERTRFWQNAAEDLARSRQETGVDFNQSSDFVQLDGLANEGLWDEPDFFTPEEDEQIRAEINAESSLR